MNPQLETPDAAADDATAPPCVLSFNVSEPTGAAGLAADQATAAAMGAHLLPVVTGVLVRDTAESFDIHPLDDELVVEQARAVLEDITIQGWKVGFLGSAETVAAVAEVLSDYPDLPLVTYLGATPWLDDEQQVSYHDALRELVLPQTQVLVGSHAALTEFLLPEWDNSRPASPRELANAAHQSGAAHVLVTGIVVPNQHVDNVLAGPQGPITGEKFERFEASFIGAGETLSGALAALLAEGLPLHEAVGEALTFLDQSLDAGFQPGMGQIIPDRYFWALPPEDEMGDDSPGGSGPAGSEPDAEGNTSSPPSRRMH
ncbi:bifunctional hydroxymethylpyrimidine kinase/phosphomethylpyrimidine kinase [Inhella gelatinilytica]|uniref:Bifunctional hydroxymethylpyrimidine kinase/phosphomethylpyrimidine kinase n=1 Tax=Inhella gelatinilytica TaxID=2795030 RepID=A0A931IX73_9BURK|nr:bifunctional hydroxymethylpyrimidine kinase/phosphomethylpyrimidine kinase [Inhella gelatinilytica]MBH9553211.1 bifunctional hydroxymethylpyrimidine kinase/phosphomethylpyrimidine kinase [Inhella gelatinilytica]